MAIIIDNLKYSEVLDKLDEIIIIINPENKNIIYANKSFEDFFGIHMDELTDSTDTFCKFFLEKEGYIKAIMNSGQFWTDYIFNNPTTSHKTLLKDKDGYYHHFNIYLKKIKGETEFFMVTFSNITEIISIQDELKLEKILLKEYKKVVDISTIVSKTDNKGRLTYVNEKFCEISGYSREELLGKPHNIVRHPETPKAVFKDMWSIIKKGGIWTGTLKNRAKDGTSYTVNATIAPLLDVDGNIKEYIAIRNDVTEEEHLKEDLKEKNSNIKEQNIELKRLASIDALTDSFNRRGLDDLLNLEIESHLTKSNTNLCVIMCDIDHFKKVNDTFGHQNGDEVLTKFVELLRKNLKKKDTVSRYGGEEFIIALPETSKSATTKVAESLRKVIEAYEFKKVGHITASFGVCCLSELEKGLSPDAYIAGLTKMADIRLYEAKKHGRNQVVSE